MTVRACSGEEALQTRTTYDYLGDPFARRDYFIPSDQDSGPHAYLVEQPPGSVIRPHFHSVDQFQVVVHGDGEIGRKHVGPVTLHYADAYTGYGPIEAHSAGIFYFSLRPELDRGAQYLPESKSEQRPVPGGRRHRLAPRVPPASASGLRQAEALSHRILFETEEDGLGASELRLPPSAHIELPPSRHGRYILVLSGALMHEGRPLGLWSCLYWAPGLASTTLHAGDGGVQALLMEFPAPRETMTPGLRARPEQTGMRSRG
jgi:hypothetical protein